jgi:hypothetical protein
LIVGRLLVWSRLLRVHVGASVHTGYLVNAAFDASQTQSSLAAGQVATLPAAFDIRLKQYHSIRYSAQWHRCDHVRRWRSRWQQQYQSL